MLAYFKDTSAKILRVQISKCTDAIPQATPQASPRKRPLVAEPRGGPLTTAQSAAPAAPKQRQKCMEAAYTIPTHAIARRRRATHGFGGCLGLRMHRLGLPDHWAAPCRRAVAVPSPPHNTHARRSDPPRDATRTRRAGRRARSPRTTTSSRGTPSRRGY